MIQSKFHKEALRENAKHKFLIQHFFSSGLMAMDFLVLGANGKDNTRKNGKKKNLSNVGTTWG